MSTIESGHHAVSVRELARLDAGAPPPYGYDEFTQRHRHAVLQRRTLGWASAASVAVLGVLVGLGLRESQSPSTAQAETGSDMLSEPALLELDRFVLRSDLEDRIAWFDAALSAGGAGALPDQDLNRLQSTREELARSLQQVTYAHAVLDL